MKKDDQLAMVASFEARLRLSKPTTDALPGSPDHVRVQHRMGQWRNDVVVVGDVLAASLSTFSRGAFYQNCGIEPTCPYEVPLPDAPAQPAWDAVRPVDSNVIGR